MALVGEVVRQEIRQAFSQPESLPFQRSINYAAATHRPSPVPHNSSALAHSYNAPVAPVYNPPLPPPPPTTTTPQYNAPADTPFYLPVYPPPTPATWSPRVPTSRPSVRKTDLWRTVDRHLPSKIQSLKHSVPKGDKKRKKDVAAEVAVLEAELEKKQKKDLEEFAAYQSNGVASNQPEVDDVTDEFDATSLHEPSLKQGKTSKAEKRREKKRQKEEQREREIAKQEVENQFLPRAVEERELREILEKLGLTIYEIPSDGNW
ncbi:hypothetical protein HPB51_022986 [Rhipicephalus microplus]|uniref:Uncharacterized protein n=1 Tax=Rhipicephalus microplus TaxID=6941 RepID=A0A9J6DCN2_RHIMP|nr:hypothetical protein HPB51_022986 [Rhipicephalus microplus]